MQGGGDVSPTLTTTSGICKLIAHEDLDKYIERRKMLHQQRSEYGKQIRKDYENGITDAKRAEISEIVPRKDNLVGTITTVQKDNLTMGKKTIGWIDNKKNILNINGEEIDIETLSLPDRMEIMDELPVEGAKVEDYLYKDWGVFKLSPREALRLMAVDDEDIDKMAAVNSATQLYKTAGNSIIVTVLCAIFSQLGIQGKPRWNEMTDDERYTLTGEINKNFEN